MEARIGVVAGAIGEGELLGFGEQVQVLDRVVSVFKLPAGTEVATR
jgi:hypothetical protein